MTPRRARQHASLITLFWGLAFWACSRMLVPPEIDRNPAEMSAFSIENARGHLRHIAAKPHPVGSGAHAAVAHYLLEQIKALGYQAEIQETIASQRFEAPQAFVKAARIKNILVRVAGKENRGAVLIAAHYDSAETSPGAADDGAAVASMLDVLRILKQTPPLKNDLIFLFSDAEELGLLGSRAFVERHPWAKDCLLALNFEARGNAGMLLMFETSANNARLVEHYARAAVNPVASSLMFSIYRKLLHNDTDFSHFREAGMAGMNFAFIEGSTDYHTQLDNPERLDPRTLALQGRNLLQLARHFADADLKNLGRNGDLGYFNLPFGALCRYSLAHHLPLLIAGAEIVLFALVIAYDARSRRPRWLLQTAILLLQVGLVAGIGFGLHAAIMHIYPSYRWLPEPYNATLYFFAFCCITAAAFALLHLGLSRWIKPRAYADTALCVWLTAGLYLALAFPGGVYFAAVPVLAMIIDRAFRLFCLGLPSTLITGACSSAVLIIVAPTLYLAHHALGFHADWLLMIIAALTLGLISPALDILYRALGWRLPAILFAAASMYLIQADRTSSFTRERPKPDSIVYAWDGIRDTARWLSYDPEPDDWTRQFLTPTPKISSAGIFDDFVPARRMLAREIPPIPLPAPEVRVVDRHSAGGKNDLQIHIRSRRAAPVIRLQASQLAAATQIFIDEHLIHQKDSLGSPIQFIEFHGLPAAGITLRLVLPAEITFKMLEIIEIRPDLAEIQQENWKSRPANRMPMRSSSAVPVDAVILRQSYRL